MIFPRPPSRASAPTPRAFSLIELLAVILLMGLIIAFAVPAIAPLLRSSNVTKAGSMLIDELNLSRQLALAENRDVEVRFYKLPPKTGAGEPQFRAFRSFAAIGSRTSKIALDSVRYLPDSVIITTGKDGSGNLLSTLLDSDNTARTGLTTGQENLPSFASAPYIGFIFHATGGTSLVPVDPPVGNWYLTICPENVPPSATTGFPSNYFTIQIEPVTGRVRAYRP